MKRIEWLSNRKDIVLVSVFAILCAGLAFMPTGFEERLPKASRFARARVLDVENTHVRQSAIIKTGTQSLTVELLSGPFRGQKVIAVNHLSGRLELDDFLVAGREILVEHSVKDGQVGTAVARGHYRLRFQLLLVVLFAAILFLVAGWTGLKAMLSFVFSILMIWKVLIPLLLREHDPILVALSVVAALSAAVSFLVGGLTRKGLVTFVGTFSGLLLACGLAQLSIRALRLHGAVLPYAETLLYSGFYYLNLTRIFVASIFIACSGAVMDLAMDIAASMDEIRRKKPDIGFWEHIGSGMAVGRAVVGTMTTTLLLAYSGSYIGLLMLFMGQGIPLLSILNRGFMAAEVLNTIVGSLGVVAVAPLTALAGGLLYRLPFRKRKPAAEPAVPLELLQATLYTTAGHP
ncbi:MAG TPA: YibE/F family protein [Sedimentisphaerales bacterium]|jgi:uncharacterized membrane protein|nr:YibE/F family protein [Sedimentisphaerales bacterium]HNU31847.1 YibE/F family protein [Sedimentisphaerales bacterium]